MNSCELACLHIAFTIIVILIRSGAASAQVTYETLHNFASGTIFRIAPDGSFATVRSFSPNFATEGGAFIANPILQAVAAAVPRPAHLQWKRDRREAAVQ